MSTQPEPAQDEVSVNPPCPKPCPCNDYNLGPCPLPGHGISTRWCAVEGCRCIALASQGYCEGCYVATK